MSRYSKVAFGNVPFVAAGVWWLYTLGQIWLMNGRLRIRTDVLAFAFGAFTIGLFVAAALTLALAMPTYLVLEAKGHVSMASALVTGVAIGTAVGLAYWLWRAEDGLLSPAKGAIVGLASSSYWWRVANKKLSDQRVAA